MSKKRRKRCDDCQTIAEVAEALIGPDADSFLLVEQAADASDDPEAEVVEVPEEEVDELLTTFGLYWDSQGKRVVISGPPGTVERIVAILAVAYLLGLLVERLP